VRRGGLTLREELARILPHPRSRRRPADRAPREIVPAAGERDAGARLDAARERLRAQIEPRGDAG
jgi:hypothetical protein